ncbi:Centromere/kinetochore zw10-like protein [Euroglyphus maynei]|uniref:Centromere/kinetochore zw10-like protein n=1 Tax=Euroglyphus maynei TaxID=6958 RepID=A0A1Y3BE05_EURMA|nr:Centromere/kinetochore zw10-like protein [Euroglyphus maynei]
MSALMMNSSKNLSLLLMETIYLVCELFITIAPYTYRELIEHDAKENAIFHNNCLMFGHLMECMALTHKPYLDSLFELVPSIRNIGSQIFLNQMRYQERKLYRYITNETFIQSLQEIVNETPRTDLRISSQSHFEFRESLNNCLKHLNYLRCSFYQILSMKIYDKIMATLLQTLLNEFIQSLLSINDISSLGSSHLYNEIDYFCKELKLFLIDSEDVIFKWMKLNEINFLLKSSLLEILNRWADGHGLLANYLKPDEVKHLIRALFQNNERRAKVLAKIK